MPVIEFKQRLDVQCKGRNGWFWPVGAGAYGVRGGADLKSYVDISIESSRSIKGGDAPIAIRLHPEDARAFAEEILKALAAGYECWSCQGATLFGDCLVCSGTGRLTVEGKSAQKV